MLPDRVSNPGPLTNESGAIPLALSGPAGCFELVLESRSPLGKKFPVAADIG